MKGHLARWIAAQEGGAMLGEPETAAATVIAALKGLKTSARTFEDYRAGQAMLARMLALALGGSGQPPTG